MTPEQSKTEAEYITALANEKENEAYAEAIRMSRSVKQNVRNMGAIILSHRFGQDVECPCSHCK